MEIEKIKKEDRIILDFKQNHTIGNLVRKGIWAAGGEAGYDKGHPLGDESNLVVKGDDAEELVNEGIEQAKEWMEELEGSLS